MFHRVRLPGLVEIYHAAKPILCAVVLGMGPARSADCAGPAVPDDEYEVLAAMLEHGLDRQSEYVVIADTTTGDPAALSRGLEDAAALSESLDLPAPLIADWIAKNTRGFILNEPLPIGTPYRLATADELSTLFGDADPAVNWRRFHARYPKTPGLIRVSRVGFDPARAQAVVYVEFECGATCGSGRLVHLARGEAGRWRVLSGELLWVAAE
jgi:hypothetical protein